VQALRGRAQCQQKLFMKRVASGPVLRSRSRTLTPPEEVNVQPSALVDAREPGIGRARGEAIIADEVAPDGAVLLLDVHAVVLLPGATAGEGDRVATTPVGIR
jgi:hypothetical protein